MLSSCASVVIPDVTICTVAGQLSGGAICATTLSGKTSEMTLDEYIAFLEPSDSRAGALCQSSLDWNKQKTALEQACRVLEDRCTNEMKEILRNYERARVTISQ